MEVKKSQGVKKVILTKIRDDKYPNKHPEGLHVGYTKVGYLHEPITEGKGLLLHYAAIGFNPLVSINNISKVINENFFETKYAGYKLEYL